MPIDPAVRAAVEAELTTPQQPPRSRAAIAREHGIATRTVSRWADELGLTDPFSTRDVRAATEAATDRRRAVRSSLADRALVEAGRALDDMHKPHIAFSFGGKNNDYNEHEFNEPPVEAKQRLMVIYGIAIDKSLAIDKHDVRVVDDDAAGATLTRLFDGLAAAYRVLDHTPDPADDDELGDADDEREGT